MQRIKQCGLFALSFALVLTASFTAFSNSVSAASDFDNVVIPVDNLNLECASTWDGSLTGKKVDLTNNWSQLLDPSKTDYEGTTLFRYGASNQSSATSLIWDSFQDRLDDGKGFAVTAHVDGWGHLLGINVFIQDDNSAPAYWDYADKILRLPNSYSVNFDCDDHNRFRMSYDDTPRNRGVYGPPSDRTFFINYDLPSNPLGYEGQPIPNAPPAQTQVIYPTLNYQVSGKKLTAQYKENVPQAKQIDWFIYKADDSWNSITPSIYNKSKQISKDKNLVYEFDKKGKYYLAVEVHNPAPWSPIPEEYDVRVVMVPLEIDGSNFEGSTDDPSCNDGMCEQYSPYLDCSEFSGSFPFGINGGEFPDIINGFGCQLTNFATSIKIMLTALFVPDETNTEFLFNLILDGFKSTLGFIYQTVEFVVDFVGSFLFPSDDISICNWSFGNIFNNNFKLNICSFQQQFPAQFSTVQFMIQALTVFGLLTGLYMEYRRVIRT